MDGPDIDPEPRLTPSRAPGDQTATTPQGVPTMRRYVAVALTAAVLFTLSAGPTAAAHGRIATVAGIAMASQPGQAVTATCDGSTLQYQITGVVNDSGIAGSYAETGTATLAGSADPADLWRGFNTPAATVVGL